MYEDNRDYRQETEENKEAQEGWNRQDGYGSQWYSQGQEPQ